MIKAIAIDDEPVALDIIRMHAAKVDFIELKQVFGSAKMALAYLADEAIDLVFLDINMPDITGLEFAALLAPGMQVIFTTAHTAYALAGFDLAITDFLLKPINYNRFLQACTQAKNRLIVNGKPDKDTLFVKDGYKWVKIDLEVLLYARAEDNYISLAEPGKQTLIRMTMQELAGKLPAHFMKVHKSYIVNTRLIENLESYQLSIGGVKIPIAKPFMDELKKMLAI